MIVTEQTEKMARKDEKLLCQRWDKNGGACETWCGWGILNWRRPNGGLRGMGIVWKNGHVAVWCPKMDE
jgi:hypothetical protein